MVDEQSRDLIDDKPKNPSDKSEVRKQVDEFLGKRYEVHLKDGRLVRGLLIATDKDANMIFHSAEESWSQNRSKGSRHLGQAMIAKKHVKAMYVLPDLPPRRHPNSNFPKFFSDFVAQPAPVSFAAPATVPADTASEPTPDAASAAPAPTEPSK